MEAESSSVLDPGLAFLVQQEQNHHYVKFRRWISFEDSAGLSPPFQEVGQGHKKEVFTISPTVKRIRLKCEAEINPGFIDGKLRGNGSENLPTVRIGWRNSRNTELSRNETLELEGFENEEEDFRCFAKISAPAATEGSYKYVDGVVLSRAVKLRKSQATDMTLEPAKQTVAEGGLARFSCLFNISGSHRIGWEWIDGSEIREIETTEHSSNRTRIFTTSDQSLLHITNVSSSSGIRCSLIVDNVRVQSAEASIQLDNGDQTYSPPKRTNKSYVRRGFNTILECLPPAKTHFIKWTMLQKHKDGGDDERVIVGNTSAFVFDSSRYPEGGNFECQMGPLTGASDLEIYVFDVFVKDDSYFDYEEDISTKVTKIQGTMAKMLCETYPQVEETPDMAKWYKDGVEFNTNPRAKLTSIGVDSHYQGVSLSLSIVEPEDEGIYECIVRNKQLERIHQTVFVVERGTTKRLSNLRVGVDHANACFHVNFQLPASAADSVSEASKKTYFLTYYKSDESRPLNSFPFNNAKCVRYSNASVRSSDSIELEAKRKRIRCEVICCAANCHFEAATDYTFRASMVVEEQSDSVITALSDPVKAYSWDAYAAKALDLELIYLEADDQLLIRWKTPDHIDGILEGYLLEIHNLTLSADGTPLAGASKSKSSVNLSAYEVIYQLEKVGVGEGRKVAYKLRLLPLTRAGKPPSNAIDSLERFGFTHFNVTNDRSTVQSNPSLSAPFIEFRQVHEGEPRIKAYWVVEIRDPADLIHFEYRPNVCQKPEDDGRVSKLNISYKAGELEITEGLETGLIYQVCAVVERNGARGFWTCSNIALKNENGKLTFYREQDAQKRCGSANKKKPRKRPLPEPVICSKDNCRCELANSSRIRVIWKGAKTHGASFYTIHYTKNETDLHAEDFSAEFQADQIESDGQVSWVELKNNGDLDPNASYRVMIEAHNEERKGVSGTYFNCRVGELKAGSVADDLTTPLNVGNKWHRSGWFNVLVVVLIVLTAILCLASGCIYLQTRFRRAEKRRLKKKAKSFEMDLLALGIDDEFLRSSAASLASSGDGALPSKQQQTIASTNSSPILQRKAFLRSDSSTEEENRRLDAKGGPGGFQPAGCQRFKQLIRDSTFRQQLIELKLDPTGTGTAPSFNVTNANIKVESGEKESLLSSPSQHRESGGSNNGKEHLMKVEVEIENIAQHETPPPESPTIIIQPNEVNGPPDSLPSYPLNNAEEPCSSSLGIPSSSSTSSSSSSSNNASNSSPPPRRNQKRDGLPLCAGRHFTSSSRHSAPMAATTNDFRWTTVGTADTNGHHHLGRSASSFSLLNNSYALVDGDVLNAAAAVMAPYERRKTSAGGGYCHRCAALLNQVGGAGNANRMMASLPNLSDSGIGLNESNMVPAAMQQRRRESITEEQEEKDLVLINGQVLGAFCPAEESIPRHYSYVPNGHCIPNGCAAAVIPPVSDLKTNNNRQTKKHTSSPTDESNRNFLLNGHF